MILLTRRYPFSASHRLDSPKLSTAENRDAYGKCNNPHGHGHNYTLEVTVGGPLDAKLGRVVDRAALDQFVHDALIQDLDRRNLNEDVAEFKSLVPTTENLATVLEARLSARWPQQLPPLRRLRIFETRKNIFEIQAKV